MNRQILIALLSLFGAMPLSAQAASYSLFGIACSTGRISAQFGPVPLSARGLPRLGTSFEILTEGSARYQWGNTRTVYVLTGASNTTAGGVPLPFDVAALHPGWPYCGLLHTSGEIVVRVPTLADPLAIAPVRFDVPNHSALLGITLYQQVVSMEFAPFGPPFASMALSAAGRCVLGL